MSSKLESVNISGLGGGPPPLGGSRGVDFVVFGVDFVDFVVFPLFAS